MRQRSRVSVRTTGGAGTSTGEAVTTDTIDGWVLSVYVNHPGAAPATVDLLVQEAFVPYKQTVISKANFNTDQYINPRFPAHQSSDGVVILGQSLPVIVLDQLRVTISQADNDQYFEVEILWDDLQ